MFTTMFRNSFKKKLKKRKKYRENQMFGICTTLFVIM